VVVFLIEVKRKGEERADVLVRRFNREIQQSGILTLAKKKRYFEKELNRNAKRRSAVRRAAILSSKRGY
jgi:ribosomal protein S21